MLPGLRGGAISVLHGFLTFPCCHLQAKKAAALKTGKQAMQLLKEGPTRAKIVAEVRVLYSLSLWPLTHSLL